MSQSPITTIRRWLVLTGGGIVFVACLVVGVSLAGGSLPEIVRWPGDDSLVVVAFVTVVTLLGAFILNLNFVIKNEEWPVPEPETTPPVPQAGSELDRIMEARFLGHPSPDERRRVRERLRQTAIQTIQRGAGVSRPRAVALLTNGEWTTNQTAAAFLGETALPRSLRLCEHVSRRLVFQHEIRQTARAIVAYANESEDQ